jgi:hypothetical protein
MLLDSKTKNIILISNDVLIQDDLFIFLETLDFQIKSLTVKEENIRILLDKSVHNEISNYESKDRKFAIRIKGIINILKNLKVYGEIDTIQFREFKDFLELQKKEPEFVLNFITHQQAYASKLNLDNKDQNIHIEKFEDGILVPWEFEEDSHIVTDIKQEKVVFEKAFYTKDKTKYVSVSKDVDLDYVYSVKYGFLHLDQNNVMFGGEAKIYRTYENLLVKIYSEDERRYETIKKIQLLMDLDLRNKYIVWPKDIVYNNNEFVGYVMEEILNAKGLDMYRIYSFRNISYVDRFKIAIKLLEMIQYLHSRDILVGDLKFDNILYQEQTKDLYIIDSGSFQLEDYSCGVFNAAYTHDNLKGKNLREVLRTLEEEYFPINKILFEILMGKGPFYDFVTGEVGSEVERTFHYPMEYDKPIQNQNDPLFYWVNGDERLRYAFYDYFAKGIITEVDQWIKLLEDILNKEA